MDNPRKNSSNQRSVIIVTLVNKSTSTCLSRVGNNAASFVYNSEFKNGVSRSGLGTKFIMIPLNGKDSPRRGEDFYLKTVDGKRYLERTKLIDQGDEMKVYGSHRFALGFVLQPTQTWQWHLKGNHYELPLNTPIFLSCGGKGRNPAKPDTKIQRILTLRSEDSPQTLLFEGGLDEQICLLSFSNLIKKVDPMESCIALIEPGNSPEEIKLKRNICTEMGPFGESSSDGGTMAAIGLNFWPKNQVLTISLIDTSSPKILLDIRLDKIKRAVSAWEKCCSIRFKFLSHNNSKALIRVTFNPNSGSWSYVGLYIKKVSSSNPTMNLGWIDEYQNDDDGTIKHEFGHVLGLCHEHQHPKTKIKWNKNVIYNYYQKHFGWDKKMVDENILHRYTFDQVVGTAYDTKSIMHYDFAAVIAGKEYHRNNKLSLLDKKFIKEIYGPRYYDPSRLLPTVVIFGAIVFICWFGSENRLHLK